jgi:hypothetical protein
MLMQPIQAVTVPQRIGSNPCCSRFIVLLALSSPQLKGGIWFQTERCVDVTNSSYDCQVSSWFDASLVCWLELLKGRVKEPLGCGN